MYVREVQRMQREYQVRDRFTAFTMADQPRVRCLRQPRRHRPLQTNPESLSGSPPNGPQCVQGLGLWHGCMTQAGQHDLQ